MEYLLKSALISAILFAFYKAFLQSDTFFASNRLFFFVGIFLAIFLPLLIIPVEVYITVPQTSQIIQNSTYTQTNNTDIANTIVKTTNSIDWLSILLRIYWTGTLLFSLKLLLELASLAHLIYSNPKKKYRKSIFVESQRNIPPFSFFIWIVFNKSQFNDYELKQIINHEQIHVTHWHSVDLILIQLLTIIQWFNPFVWLYKKELQQNLEYIADKKANEKEMNLKDYQYLLLKTGIGKDPFALTNNFFNSHLKKRIIMLQKSKTNRFNQIKYALLIPLLAIFMYSFGTKEVYVIKQANKSINVSKTVKQEPLKFTNPINPKKLTRMASGYGMRIHPILKTKRMHKGMDFVAPKGTPVFASASGTVLEAATTNTLGKIIRIKHTDDFQTNYYHLSAINVKTGDQVVSGDLIGKVGNTGKSMAPHLHFEIQKEGVPVNPINYLPIYKKKLKKIKQNQKSKKYSKVDTEKYKRVIDKNTTDSDLEEITSFYAKLEIAIAFSSVKRNKKDEITGIFISIKSEKSNYSYHFDTTETIQAFILDYDSERELIVINNTNQKNTKYVISIDDTDTKTSTSNQNSDDSLTYTFSIDNEVVFDSLLNRKITLTSDNFTKKTLNKICFDSINRKSINWTGNGENALTINIDDKNGIKTYSFNGKVFSEEEFYKLNESDYEFLNFEGYNEGDFIEFKNKEDDFKYIEEKLKKHEKMLKKQEKALRKKLKRREKELKKREKELLKREKELKKEKKRLKQNKVGFIKYQGKDYYYVNDDFYNQFGNKINGQLQRKLLKQRDKA
jgi:hypothetical protein